MALATSTMLLIGAGIAAAGAVSQAQAAKKEAKFKSKVEKQQAAREREIAAAEERDFRKRQSALLAQRRAELGGSGVSGATGTPLLAEEDFLRESELQAQRIREGGEISATRLEQQAKMTKMAGKSAAQRGYFRAGSSLLTGIGGAMG